MKTYYRVIKYSQFKITVSKIHCFYYKRLFGAWVLITQRSFYAHADYTPFQARLKDGSFLEMLRKDL